MAVSSKKKKDDDLKTKKETVKKKSSINKTKKNDSKQKESVQTIIETENIETKKEEVILPKKRKNYYWILLIIIIIGIIYLMLPKIKINGQDRVTIRYNQLYKEPGYRGKWLFKDITNNIKVKSNLNTTKVGTYQVNYEFKFFIFNLKRKRTVEVIDDVEPLIIVPSKEINVCPNASIPEIKYQALDEYDGDITNKVVVNDYQDKILLAVSDNANNTVGEEITIDRSDKEDPKIELKGKETIYLNVGSTYHEPGYTATDNCDGDLTDKVEKDGDVGSSAGEYKITYSVSDNSGNKTEVIRKVIVKNYNLYNSGSIGNGVIYLTFDDGPSEGTTNVILDILKDEGIKATFFVTCKGPDYLIKRIYDEGHMVALHTCSHEYSQVYSSVDNYFNDLNKVSNRVKNITGYDAKIIRFPGGSSNTVSRNYSYGIMSTLTGMVLDKGYRYFDWNIDSNDAGGAGSSNQVYNNVINNLSHNRSNVILMHDIKSQTRDALRDIIQYGKSEGYLFGRLENDTYMIRHSVNN